MALTRNETKVLFSTANSVSIATVSNNISDLISLDVTTIEASITVKANNVGTPASGDTVDVFILLSSGDPDGSPIADEFSSADSVHARFIGQLDTFTTNPAILTIPYPNTPTKGKLFTKNNGASSVTFSAVIEELRSA